MPDSTVEPDMLFEVSWEVCNKVGGIYTVVMSKAALMKKWCKEYILIGPYFDKSRFEFEPAIPNEKIAKAIQEMNDAKIPCMFGKWKIEGEPNVILIDFKNLIAKKNDIKKELWEHYKIDSLFAKWDFEEPITWSYAAGMLIEKIVQSDPLKKASVQCHEWLSGGALLYLKAKKIKIGTVFTTHATMLGRAIAGNNRELYAEIKNINPEEEAYALKIQEKFLTEKACANTADCFTTVSEITALEAERFFGRKPEVLVLNGLDIHKFPTIEETSIKHVTVRERIRQFLMYYFFPYYSFDLSHNLIYFIIGRYEFRNKGLDIFIKSLGKLNETLKKEGSDRTISVFFWIPAQNSGIRSEVFENKNYYHHIRSFVNYHGEEILGKVISNIVGQKELNMSNLFSKEFMDHIQREILHFKRAGNPPLSTHYMDEEHDAMICEMRKNGLLNRQEDLVKVIVYPVYLDGSDEMINLNYYDTIAGCHLGVFPSYYEPWGYTPLEAAGLGVSSLTTDLSGFGQFIQKHQEEKEGIFVLKRAGRKDDEVINDFHSILYDYSMLSHEDRVHNKTVAKTLAALADWSILINNYQEAHKIAIKKAYYPILK